MKNKRDGFSLVEVALGLLIIGIIIGPMIDAWGVYKKQQQYSLTTGNLATVKTALQKYVLNTGTYPAPADPGVASSNANFGKETALTLTALLLVPCVPDKTVVCKTVGYRDTNADGVNDPVLVGDLPFATIGLPESYATDGYGNKFTYAVSAYLTDKSTVVPFGDGNGVIKVIDSTGADTANTTTASPPAGPIVHYVVFSHGKDGVGAFTLAGTEPILCAGAIGKDVENCNNDGKFNSNSGTYNDVNGAEYGRLESSPAGANHFDDYLGWTTSTTGDIWVKQPGVAANIVNNNSGNVRVGGGGVVAPQAKVDVRGILMADKLTTNDICDTSANSYVAPNYTNAACKPAGGTGGLVNAWPKDVFSPAIIAGTVSSNDANKSGGGILCSTPTGAGALGLGLSGIADSDEECNNAVTPGKSIGTCTIAGTAPYGISAAGVILCSAPPSPGP